MMELRKDVVYVATKTVTVGFVGNFVVEAGTRVRLDDIFDDAVGIVTPPHLSWSDNRAEYGGMERKEFEEAFVEE